LQQLFMASTFTKSSIFDDMDHIAMPNRRQSMGDCNGRPGYTPTLRAQ
jgi:hypothetical protein